MIWITVGDRFVHGIPGTRVPRNENRLPTVVSCESGGVHDRFRSELSLIRWAGAAPLALGELEDPFGVQKILKVRTLSGLTGLLSTNLKNHVDSLPDLQPGQVKLEQLVAEGQSLVA